MILNKWNKFSYLVCNKNIYRLKYSWIKPEGYDTGIKIYNPFVKAPVPLIFPNKNLVKWYICGPTVYDTSHIGHASCYIRFDMMRRALEKYFDIKPIVALGVTDIAQNITKKAMELHLTPAQVAAMYKNEFFKQMDALNILPPHVKLHVSHHVDKIRAFVTVLQEKKLAYKKGDDIVFPIKSDKNYGRFQSPEARGISPDLEFSLWRSKEPGWHVECSAMASYIFGSCIDIHSGGRDLMYPHHENEEGLSTCYHDCDQWVNYWVHSGLIHVKDEKMSKSLGNLISISDFLHNNSSDHLRMLCLMNPYRTDISFDTEKLNASVKLCRKIQRFLSLSQLYILGQWPNGCVSEAELLQDVENTKRLVIDHIKQDFGTDLALKEVVLLLRKVLNSIGEETTTSSRSNLALVTVHDFVKDFFKTFGFSFDEFRDASSNPVESMIDAAVNFRMSIRENVLRKPDFQVPLKLCDAFRNDLGKLGITINDLSHKCYWIRQSTNEISDREFLNELINATVSFRGAIMDFVNKTSAFGKELLRDECRSLKFHLSNLGIVLLDDGRSYGWTFPDIDKPEVSKYNLIIQEMVSFLERVDEVAGAMNTANTEESKKKLQILHKAALFKLRSFGLTTDAGGEVVCDVKKNPKGESILKTVIDIFIQCFDSVESLKFVSEEKRMEKLDVINGVSTDSLEACGFIIKKDLISVLSSWTFDGRIDHKNLLVVILDEIVTYIYRLKEIVKDEKDLRYKNAIMRIHDSVVQDLEDTGVVVKKIPEPYSWNFKNFSIYGKYKVGREL